jgi:RNA-splicing ligase RtcB
MYAKLYNRYGGFVVINTLYDVSNNIGVRNAIVDGVRWNFWYRKGATRAFGPEEKSSAKYHDVGQLY